MAKTAAWCVTFFVKTLRSVVPKRYYSPREPPPQQPKKTSKKIEKAECVWKHRVQQTRSRNSDKAGFCGLTVFLTARTTRRHLDVGVYAVVTWYGILVYLAQKVVLGQGYATTAGGGGELGRRRGGRRGNALAL